VRFLVDAQLPQRLCRSLASHGHDAKHCVDLPGGDRSSDDEVAVTADAEDRIVVTKDHDFRDSHLVRGTPRRLLHVTTGNVSNRDLLALFDRVIAELPPAFEESRFVELTPRELIIRADRT
jgi:predicted nuclease of predicted toxin-antitoxin system